MFRKTREKSPYYHLAIDFGYTLLAGVGVFGFLGWWLDQRYGTTPLLLICGFGLGLAVGFNSLFKRLRIVEEREKAAKKRASPQQDPRPKP